jgi:hypothetical protein
MNDKINKQLIDKVYDQCFVDLTSQISNNVFNIPLLEVWTATSIVVSDSVYFHIKGQVWKECR